MTFNVMHDNYPSTKPYMYMYIHVTYRGCQHVASTKISNYLITFFVTVSNFAFFAGE